jgi:RNA polymerase sigma factor (sigma-70 family)
MIDDATLRAWFFREVFPLEPALTRCIRRNWRNESEVADLRQEICARIYSAARERLPLQTKPFLFTIARNHLINQAKRAQVVSIDHVAGLESSPVLVDAVTPDRHVTAREELRRGQAGLDRLPPRWREVIVLRKIEGLSEDLVAGLKAKGHKVQRSQIIGATQSIVIGPDGVFYGAADTRRPDAEAVPVR